jgi:hypothetical protein
MSDVAVVINSFDRYSDCWGPVTHGLHKYWADCPYPIYLISNFKNFKAPGVCVLKTGADISWSDRLHNALTRLDATYIIYFQEDYWLTKPADTARVRDYLRHMDHRGLHYVRLLAAPAPAHDFPDDVRLGIIAREGDYRTSAQIALWRREVLCELLVPGESVWEFEIEGTNRSRRYGDTFLSVKPHHGDPYYWGFSYVCTAINAGHWSRAAKAYARDEGLSVDFSHLPSESWWRGYQRVRWGGRTLRQVSLHRAGMLVTDPTTFVDKLRSRMVRLRRGR